MLLTTKVLGGFTVNWHKGASYGWVQAVEKLDPYVTFRPGGRGNSTSAALPPGALEARNSKTFSKTIAIYAWIRKSNEQAFICFKELYPTLLPHPPTITKTTRPPQGLIAIRLIERKDFWNVIYYKTNGRIYTKFGTKVHPMGWYTQ